ncbi:Protein FRG1 [Armadillidium nasatum]|uniref:Protein FRG1 n=1 Tax=Armadillidium nasatum TaxID=96803 RepID=A0A5N5TBJ6_9CRUS|nr:Protein FRG1 [Armadillidium nasatum]
MSEYKRVKTGKLTFKGEKSSHKKQKSKKRKAELDEPDNKDHDMLKHGGWWKASSYDDVKGSVAIQFGSTPVYVKALNHGLFTLGALHEEAFKSGYGKYLSVDSKGRVTGVADAIGPREHWEPVFQDNKLALLGANDCFLGVDDEDNVIAKNSKATGEEMVAIRCISERDKEQCDQSEEMDKGKLKEVELGYVKMFQKFQDKRIKINPDGRAELKDAKTKGKLHESLLDRRSKMKADRYCK